MKFSESRWLTMGPSCQAVLTAHLTGIASLITRVRADPRSSNFYLHGFARMNQGILDLCVVSEFSTPVADAIMAELLEDGRVVRRLEVLEDIVVTELRFVHKIPGTTFDPHCFSDELHSPRAS